MKAISEFVKKSIYGKTMAVTGIIKNDMLCEIINRHAQNGTLICSKANFDIDKIFLVDNSIKLNNYYVKGLYGLPEFKEDLLTVVYSVIDSYFFEERFPLMSEITQKWDEILPHFYFADICIKLSADCEEDYYNDEIEDESFDESEEDTLISNNPYDFYDYMGTWRCILENEKEKNIWINSDGEIAYFEERNTGEALSEKTRQGYLEIKYHNRSVKVPIAKKDGMIYLKGEELIELSSVKYIESNGDGVYSINEEKIAPFFSKKVFGDYIVEFADFKSFFDNSITKCFDRIEYSLLKNDIGNYIAKKFFYSEGGLSDFDESHKKYHKKSAAVSELVFFFEFLEWCETNIEFICKTAISKAPRKKDGTLYKRRGSYIDIDFHTEKRHLFYEKNIDHYKLIIDYTRSFGFFYINR